MNSLQTRAVDDLHVDTELAGAVVEDEDADAAAARVEGGLEALPEVGLVHDGEILLDVAGLGHGDNYYWLTHPIPLTQHPESRRWHTGMR